MLAAVIALLGVPQEAAARKIVEETRCTRTVVERGTEIEEYKGDRVCVDFQQPREFQGIWVNQFEGIRFVENARTLADIPTGDGIERVWFTIDEQTRMPAGWRSAPLGRAYRVRFRGRAAQDMHRKPLDGYGHFGMSAGLVLVDELFEIEDLGETSRSY